ncbi:MAG: hypothetical protein ACTSW1_06230 [Candidatus Hodarchaeales archaeon]
MSKNIFLWNYVEDSLKEIEINYEYNVKLDLNVSKNNKDIPIIMNNLEFSKTMTKTMVKKESDDQDPSL